MIFIYQVIIKILYKVKAKTSASRYSNELSDSKKVNFSLDFHSQVCMTRMESLDLYGSRFCLYNLFSVAYWSEYHEENHKLMDMTFQILVSFARMRDERINTTKNENHREESKSCEGKSFVAVDFCKS